MAQTEIISMNALEAITGAEINSQVATARRFPRDVERCIQHATQLATMTQEIAEDCHFSVPRGGKDIEGPSVRLAEILASTWTNLRVGARVLEVGEREVVCQGVAFDAESNVAISKEVRRPIVYSDKGERAGRRYGDDQIMLTANAGSSIAFRNAVFACIPQAIWWPVYEAALRVMHDGKVPMMQRAQKALAWFKARGVDTPAILAFLKVGTIGAIGETEYDRLVGVKNALAEGATTIQDVFGIEPAPTGTTPRSNAPAGSPEGETRRPRGRPRTVTATPVPPTQDPQPVPRPDPPRPGEDVLAPVHEEGAPGPGEATNQELYEELRNLQGRLADPNALREIHQAAGGRYLTKDSSREDLLTAISKAEQLLER